MTADFAEDFCNACEKEGEEYLLLYRTSEGGYRVRWAVEPNGEKEILDMLNFVMQSETDG